MDAVVFNSVSKRFRHHPALFNWLGQERGGATEALRGVSLSVATGGVLVLLGPNGSGKTTTLKLISTMLIPDSGTVAVCGADTQQDGDSVRRKVGFAMAHERTFFPRLTARENLDFFAVLEDVPKEERGQRTKEKLALTGLADAADTLVMKFSSGMYQRLGVARALLKNPEILLLDEPTRSLDPGSAMRFWPFVRHLSAARTTVVLTTHNFQEAAAVGDQVAVLQQGALMAERRFGRSAGVEEIKEFYFQAAPDSAGNPDEVPAFEEAP
jgi:ABC-2 type transport system ATP-binding protein